MYDTFLKIGYYIGDTPIVNKKYNLSSNYTYLDNKELYDEATSNFSKMVADAEKEGLTIETLNRYRSYEHQNFIYNYYEARCEDVESFSAKPGFSEHQTGLAYDVGNSDPNTKANISFEQTKEYNWLKNNSYKYGFILRYPKGKTAITGYTFEPWHYRYVGTELSYKVYESGLTLEEYFGI